MARTSDIIVLLPEVASGFVLPHNVGDQVVPQFLAQLLGGGLVRAGCGAIVTQSLARVITAVGKRENGRWK